MDANGVLASLCFPTFPGFSGASLARSRVDPELSKAVYSACNDWHLDELTARYAGRYIPMCIVPCYDPDAAAAEIHRVAKKGARSISLPETPYVERVGWPAFDEDDFWDPIFKAVCDNDLVVSLHTGLGVNLLKRPKTAEIGTLGRQDDLIILGPTFSTVATVDLMRGGTFLKFPDLRVAMSEGGIGWVPMLLDRMDRHMYNHPWTGLKLTPDGLTPSELWRRNFLGCFITDPTALRVRDRIGIETIAWECDYPHSDSTWPRSPELLLAELQAAGCAPEEVSAITWQNAARFYRWDPFAVIPKEKATVGALRASASDVDISETSRGEYRRRWDEHYALG
jgi:predicted TIM-barrel fold metal-dependent hydrolase